MTGLLPISPIFREFCPYNCLDPVKIWYWVVVWIVLYSCCHVFIFNNSCSVFLSSCFCRVRCFGSEGHP